MFIEELLKKEEGKTLEFKQDVSSLNGIIKTVVAFANTAGGTIVIGVEDGTKKVIGLSEPLEDEMRIINKIVSSVMPSLIPSVDIQTYRNKSLILIQVPYLPGPFYVKKEGEITSYVRFGSTNRAADDEALATMRSLARNVFFDEMPCMQATVDDIDWKGTEESFLRVNREISKTKAKSIGLFVAHTGEDRPSNGGMLLFGKNRASIFPDAIIRCVRFAGLVRGGTTLDHTEIDRHLPDALDAVEYFIVKNTYVKSTIGRLQRIEVPQYPLVAVREAIINALVHTDYAMKGSSIIVAIFDDRIEITNPGRLPYGLSMEDALAGYSRCRNRVIARTFHLLGFIEQWGSGLQKIIKACLEHGLKAPKFEELGLQFRITLYAPEAARRITEQWQKDFIEHLQTVGGLGTSDAASFWKVDIRHARRRLKELMDEGIITKVGTSKNDPFSKYVVVKK